MFRCHLKVVDLPIPHPTISPSTLVHTTVPPELLLTRFFLLKYTSPPGLSNSSRRDDPNAYLLFMAGLRLCKSREMMNQNLVSTQAAHVHYPVCIAKRGLKVHSLMGRRFISRKRLQNE